MGTGKASLQKSQWNVDIIQPSLENIVQHATADSPEITVFIYLFLVHPSGLEALGEQGLV